MGSPNINQKLYLAKALNENTEGMFDHEEINEDHDEICEILAEMLNDVLDEAAPKQHSPRNQAAIDAMKKRGQKEKKRRYADAEAAIRAGNAKPTHVTDGGRVSYWRTAHR